MNLLIKRFTTAIAVHSIHKFLIICFAVLEDGSGDQTLGKGQPVIGRKGIGELSVLFIALINKRKWKSQHE